MGLTKSGSNNVRKITKVGKGSLAITLPKDITKSLGWREKQKVKITRITKGIIIRDWRK